MIADVLLTVAVVAVAPGAVPELQIRVGEIGFAAYRAAVGVWGFGFCSGCLIRACIEGDYLRLLFCTSGLFASAQHPAEIGPPGNGHYIQHIGPEKQEIVGKGDDAEQIIGKGKRKQIQNNDDQIEQRKDPGLDGNKEKQQKMGVRIQCGIAEKQAQVQIGHIGLSAKNQTVDVHEDHTGQVEQIKF